MSEKMILKDINVTIKEVDDKERTLTVVGSKEVVDRDKDIVKLDGINLKNWKKNPVVLRNHDYHDFPIAKGVGRKAWIENKNMMFKLQFATEEEYPIADTAFKLYKGGYMNAFSIGFVPNFEKIEYPEKHKGGAKRIFHEIELLEISAVSVPANADALRAGINKAWDDGVVNGSELNEWEDMIKELEDNVEETQVDAGQILTGVVYGKEVMDKKEKTIQENEIKIAELELMLKEQQIEEDIVDYDSYLGELFDEFKPSDSNTEEPEDDAWIDEALDDLEKE